MLIIFFSLGKQKKEWCCLQSSRVCIFLCIPFVNEAESVWMAFAWFCQWHALARTPTAILYLYYARAVNKLCPFGIHFEN